MSDISSVIVEQFKSPDFLPELTKLAVSFGVSLLIIVVGLIKFNLTRGYQNKVIQLDRLRFIKELIDSRAWSSKSHKFLIEKALESYTGFYMKSELIEAIFMTDSPSLTVDKYTMYRFNTEMDIQDDGSAIYTKTFSKPAFVLIHALIFAGCVTVLAFTAILTVAFFPLLVSASDSKAQVVIFSFMIVAITVIWLTASGAYISIDRMMNQLLSNEEHEELLVSLNEAEAERQKVRSLAKKTK